MTRRVAYILFLLIFAIGAKAQFVEVDWSRFERDTILPLYTTTFNLPDDAHLYRYSVNIEYPETEVMTKAEAERYKVVENRALLSSYPLPEFSIGVSSKKYMLDVSFVPIIFSQGKYMRVKSFKPVIKRELNVHAAMQHVMAAPGKIRGYAPSSVLASGKWTKICVPSEGVYKITDAQLRKMGFSNPDKVSLFGYGGEVLPETGLNLLPDDLQEIPLWREDGYMLFYANGTVKWEYSAGRYVHKQNIYSDFSYYFLCESDTEPMQFPLKEYSSPAVTYTTYPDYALREKEEYSLCRYGRALLEEYDYSSGRSVSYTFDLEGVQPGSNAIIDLSFGSNATTKSSVSVEVNKIKVGSLSLPKADSHDDARISQTSFSTTNLSAQTGVMLTHTVSNALVSGHLDFIRINYTRSLSLRGSNILFRGAANSVNATFEISNTTPDTHVWQVTNPEATTEVTGSYSNGKYAVVAPAGYDEKLVAVDVKGEFPSPVYVGAVENQNLHAVEQADMVIVIHSHRAFINEAERLAQAHREMDGLSVEVVTAEQVYNEFSSGTPDATAYRRFMKMLYDRAESAETAPKYLLLFGDGVSDNRLITYPRTKQDNMLLTYQSENSVSSLYSYVLEDYFGYLDDNEGGNFIRDKVDVGVGRLPVQTASQAKEVVDKLIAYMHNKTPGSWQNVILLLADDGDKSIPNQHMKDAEAIAGIFRESFPSFMVDRIYWDDYPVEVLATGNSYPLVTDAIYNRLAEGALVVNYSGHGSASVLSHELVWKTTDMTALKSSKVPFWVTASCDITPFDIGDGSLGESAILNPNGAAIGLLTSTRTVLQTYNAIINQQFMKHLVTPDAGGRMPTVGDALRLAKCAVISAGTDLSENKLQYVLVGDPALRLHVPRHKVVVDRFNAASATEEGRVSAGGMVEVEGYIKTSDGDIATGYKGTISTTMFDCIEDVYTRNNTDLGAYQYTAFRKKLYMGNDSVVDGRFKLSIPVPMDISYSDEQGMMNFFATDSAGNSAQGCYDNFTVGGTSSSLAQDNEGPQIEMYLNTESFISGDEVNSTPRLFVKLFDESGINTVGTGVGHDIMAIVDNNIKYTYNLNSTFVATVGDYRSGSIEFSLDSLPQGEHTLLLRAWDLYNNSSTDTLHFVVVPNLSPDLVDVKVTPNPLRYGENACFMLTHNRPGCDVNVSIELFNFQGQVLWRYDERIYSDTNACEVNWNVAMQNGAPIPTGVYLYRATISEGGGSARSKTRKLIVLNNK